MIHARFFAIHNVDVEDFVNRYCQVKPIQHVAHLIGHPVYLFSIGTPLDTLLVLLRLWVLIETTYTLLKRSSKGRINSEAFNEVKVDPERVQQAVWECVLLKPLPYESEKNL